MEKSVWKDNRRSGCGRCGLPSFYRVFFFFFGFFGPEFGHPRSVFLFVFIFNFFLFFFCQFSDHRAVAVDDDGLGHVFT